MVDERERARVAEAENAELREQLAKARDPQRIGGTADPESFVYAIEQLREFRWQHATNDEEAIPYINNVVAAHERENAKLRKLAAILCHCMQIKALCDDCCIDGHKGELARDPLCACDGLHRMLCELGVEVNE